MLTRIITRKQQWWSTMLLWKSKQQLHWQQVQAVPWDPCGSSPPNRELWHNTTWMETRNQAEERTILFHSHSKEEACQTFPMWYLPHLLRGHNLPFVAPLHMLRTLSVNSSAINCLAWLPLTFTTLEFEGHNNKSGYRICSPNSQNYSQTSHVQMNHIHIH